MLNRALVTFFFFFIDLLFFSSDFKFVFGLKVQCFVFLSS